ncbi:hypothetical protein CC86DRAFT_60844 [Ophiobolus disseminans]|uniref:Uncharacterized protein n=1 Tax=Ophiobolus disseminans TaxID=1469910 RepID=A0A6A6ZSR7_9PLEO|nr:hypothetical protein CC86DRAFT_60844 [Ophiobolus disseminans]
MKNLKTKASRFFRDSPSQDEKVANSELGTTDFDAGIQNRNVKKKASRFFMRKHDKTNKEVLTPPSNALTSSLAISETPREQQSGRAPQDGNKTASDKPCPFPPAPTDLDTPPESLSGPSSTHGSVKPEGSQLKPHPSFATLRSKGSRLFRNNSATSSPPPPPVPQIPVELVPPQSRRASVLTPLHSSRNSARNSRSSFVGLQSGSASISRPVLLPQYSNLPIPENAVTVPFTKPSGPPPVRPSRPDSLDEDIIALMQQSGTRMVLTVSNRISGSTASDSTPRSHASSIEARLGLPSGMGTPRNHSLDSPLAARFPLDPFQPLQVRDSTGSVTVSRFSEFVKAEGGGYAGDGVEEEDRERGPIEQYNASREGDWTLEKRVSKGPTGNPGMLFRDRWGAFHFVADI